MKHRLTSLYLVVTAGWVTVHFLQHTIFDSDLSGSHLEDPDRFVAVDPFIAVAFLLTTVTAYQTVRREDKKSPPSSGWLYSHLFLYASILVAIPFFANWFAAQGHTDDGLLWIYVETAGPLTWVVQAVRLWRGTPIPRENARLT